MQAAIVAKTNRSLRREESSEGICRHCGANPPMREWRLPSRSYLGVTPAFASPE